MAYELSHLNIRSSTFENCGDKPHMEDGFCLEFVTNNDSRQTALICAIFDGHGGTEALFYVRNRLFQKITEDPDLWNDEEVLACLRRSFAAMQHDLENQADFPIRSGTAVTLAVLKGNRLFVGHIGHTSLVIGIKKSENELEAQSITKSHLVTDKEERKRVTEAGGVVSLTRQPKVIWNKVIKTGGKHTLRSDTEKLPYLILSRSMGDMWSRNPRTGKLFISQIPDLYQTSLNPDVHKCILLTTNGVHDIISPQDAVTHIWRNELHFRAGPATYKYWPKHAHSLGMRCLEQTWQEYKDADNVACVVLMISPPTKVDDNGKKLTQKKTDVGQCSKTK